MKSYLVKTPNIFFRFFPRRVWCFPNNSKAVFLTFDDGPIPEITPWVLTQLKNYQAKATFFCVGENIEKHPDLTKKIIQEGHTVGNHTFNHLNGWKTNTKNYIENILKTQSLITAISSKKNKNNIFRPPYGKILPKQASIISKMGYKIIMWDVLSADFDSDISKETCLKNVLKHLSPGSIVVFHDSIKTKEKLTYVLPKVLAYIANKNWNCEAI